MGMVINYYLDGNELLIDMNWMVMNYDFTIH